MRRTRFDDWDCSVARTVDILGDWWTPMIIRSAFVGARRFEQFSESLGIPRNVLTERLNRLVDEGIMKKVEYQERHVRHDYRLKIGRAACRERVCQSVSISVVA